MLTCVVIHVAYFQVQQLCLSIVMNALPIAHAISIDLHCILTIWSSCSSCAVHVYWKCIEISMKMQFVDMCSVQTPMLSQMCCKGVGRFAQGRRWYRLVPFCALGWRGIHIGWLDSPPHLQVFPQVARPKAPCAPAGCCSLTQFAIGNMSSRTHVYLRHMYHVGYCIMYFLWFCTPGRPWGREAHQWRAGADWRRRGARRIASDPSSTCSLGASIRSRGAVQRWPVLADCSTWQSSIAPHDCRTSHPAYSVN